MSNIDDILTQHSNLVERVNEEGVSNVQFEIETLIKVIKTTGSTTKERQQRNQLRSLLVYWGGIINDKTGKYPDIELPPTVIQPDKVFISWSRGSSSQIATLLSDWLPNLLKDVNILKTSSEIKEQSNWIENLKEQLEISQFAIVCMGPDSLDNIDHLIELGAIAKTFDSERIYIILHNLEPLDLPYPINHFTWVRTNDFGILALVAKLNQLIETEPKPLDELKQEFEEWWPIIDLKLRDIEVSEIPERSKSLDVYQIAEALQDYPEAAYLYESKKFGAGHSMASFEAQLADDGTATVKRLIEVEAYSNIKRLDTFLIFPSGEDRQNTVLQHLSVRSMDPAIQVQYFDIVPDPVSYLERLTGHLQFEPSLLPGERMVYEMKESANVPVFKLSHTKNELPEKDPYEFFGWTIYRPTRRLKLAVIFPQHETAGKYFAEVRRATSTGVGSADIQRAETSRIGKPMLFINKTDNVAELSIEIDYPMMGLMYSLRWEPRYLGPEE